MRDESQRILVKELRKQNKTFTEIGNIMNLSRHAVRKLFVYQKVKHPKHRGRAFLLKNKDKLAIKRRVSMIKNAGERVDSTKIKVDCQLDMSTRTIRRYFASVGMVYRNVQRKIFLTREHKERRIEIARKWIIDDHDWKTTIFSDEKRFSLDGPDNWMTYLLKNEKINRERRQCKGGGVMVWLMVMPNGLLAHKIIDGKFRSLDYIELLRTCVVPISKLNYGNDFFFQEDNCSVHKAKSVRTFMKESNIKVLDWPAKSPDLNIVEDIWKMLSTDIYDGPQFRKTSDLKERINGTILHWNSRKREKLQALYDTIRQRLCTVLLKNGDMCN